MCLNVDSDTPTCVVTSDKYGAGQPFCTGTWDVSQNRIQGRRRHPHGRLYHSKASVMSAGFVSMHKLSQDSSYLGPMERGG